MPVCPSVSSSCALGAAGVTSVSDDRLVFEEPARKSRMRKSRARRGGAAASAFLSAARYGIMPTEPLDTHAVLPSAPPTPLRRVSRHPLRQEAPPSPNDTYLPWGGGSASRSSSVSQTVDR